MLKENAIETADGRQKRQVAEKELNELEQDLKQHLLAMRK